ncbi:MAG: hypothetical protein ACYTEQ_17735 [Planctomycetota bacterium]|jgi:hypothetical protein
MSPLNISIGNLFPGHIKSPAGDAVPWYRTSTISASDVWGAWLGKGADDYAGSKVNLNNPGVRDLTEVVGAVPWTVGAGWNFDQTNYFDTGFKADGGGLSLAIRVVNAAGSKPVMGDGGPNGIQVLSATTTIWILTNQSTDSLINVTAVADETTIVITGTKVFIDGVEDSSLVSPSPAAGSVNVFLGAFSGVPGDGTVRAAVIYDKALSDVEAVEISTNIQAL